MPESQIRFRRLGRPDIVSGGASKTTTYSLSYYAHINSARFLANLQSAETFTSKGFERCIYIDSKLKIIVEILSTIFWLFNLADTYLPRNFTIP